MVEAERASRQMVERRLAASANIFPRIVSFSWHEGDVKRDEEAVAVFKTRSSISPALSAAIKECHSSLMAPILVVPVEGGDPGYHAWIVEETTA